MNTKAKLVPLVFIVIAQIGCAKPTAQIMDSWKGSHISKVIVSWGPPWHVISDGAGGKIYIWNRNITIPFTLAKAETRRTATYSPHLDEYTIKSKTIYTDSVFFRGDKIRAFWVDKDGIVYSWKARGYITEDPAKGAAVVALLFGVVVALALLNIHLSNNP